MLVISAAAFAQSTVQPVQPVPAQTPENWVTFSPGNEAFSVQMPSGRKVLETVHTDNSKKLAARIYNAESADVFFIILTEPAGDSFRRKMGSQIEAASKYVNSFKPAAGELKIDGYNGKTYEFTDAENFHYKALLLKTDARSCVFLTVSQTQNSAGSERFFKSLRISKTSPPTDESTADTGGIIAAAPNDTGGYARSGGGSAGSNNESSGIGSGTRPPVAPAQTSKMRILSKQPAKYTDNARLFGMSGTVRLRVQFLSSGEIGAVSVVKSLPFGLTPNAIEAAKSIRFEPASKEGQPITTSGVVEYSFTIY